MIKTTDQPLGAGQPGQQQPMAPMPFYAADPNRFPAPVWQADPTQGWPQGQFIQQIPHTPQTPLEGYQQYPNAIYQPTYQQAGFETNTFYASPVQVLTPASQRPPSQSGVSVSQGSVTPRANGAYSHTPSPSPNQNGISRQNNNISGQSYQEGGYQNPSSVQSYNPTTPTNMETSSNGGISRPSSVGSNVNVPQSFTPTTIGNASGNDQPGFPQVSPSPQVASQPSSGYPGTHFSGQNPPQSETQVWEQKNYDYAPNFSQNQTQNNQFLPKNEPISTNQNFMGSTSPQNNFVNQSPRHENMSSNPSNNFINQSPQRQNDVNNFLRRPPSQPSEASPQNNFLGRPPSRPSDNMSQNSFVGQGSRMQSEISQQNYMGQSPRGGDQNFGRPPSRHSDFIGQSPRSQQDFIGQSPSRQEHQTGPNPYINQSPNRSTPLPHPSPQNPQINQSPNRPLQPPDNPFSQPERVNLNSRIKTMILNKQDGAEPTKNEQNPSAAGHFLSYSHHRTLNYADDGGGLTNFNSTIHPKSGPEIEILGSIHQKSGSAIENMIKFANDENYTKWNTPNFEMNQFYTEKDNSKCGASFQNPQAIYPQKVENPKVENLSGESKIGFYPQKMELFDPQKGPTTPLKNINPQFYPQKTDQIPTNQITKSEAGFYQQKVDQFPHSNVQNNPQTCRETPQSIGQFNPSKGGFVPKEPDQNCPTKSGDKHPFQEIVKPAEISQFYPHKSGESSNVFGVNNDATQPGPSHFYPQKNLNLPNYPQTLQEPLGTDYGKNGSYMDQNLGSNTQLGNRNEIELPLSKYYPEKDGVGKLTFGPTLQENGSNSYYGKSEEPVEPTIPVKPNSTENQPSELLEQKCGFVGVPIKKEVDAEGDYEVSFQPGGVIKPIKMEPGLEDKEPAYLFEGHGGPAPIDPSDGSWCCRKGGTNPPTLEHLKEGGCSGLQTADEIIIDKSEKNGNPDVKLEPNPTQDYLDNIEKLKNNIKTEIPDCNCFPPDKNPPEPGSYYTHLGCASSLEELRKDIETRTGVSGKGLRIEKVCYTGKEGKTTQGCPMAKWIIRRSSYEEKILAIVKHRQGHTCSSAHIVVAMVAWDGIPSHEADQTYNLLTHKLNKYGLPTTRRCATNESRTCACQGLDPDNCGASFSFGCSWSMYYNGCKYARSKTVRKFRLSVKTEENEIEEKMHILSTMLSPLYNSIAPLAFKNQCQFEREASECRLGFKTGRPFSGVTVCLDFCSHSHRDLHNMNNGCTVVVSLTKHRTLGKPPDEQLHVLPLYVIDETDEYGSKEAQEEKFKNGSIEKLSKYPCEVRVRSVPLQPCRRHGKKRKEDEPDAIIKKEAVISPRTNTQSPRSSHGSPRSHTPGSSHGMQTPLNDMANMLDSYTDAQLQSSQVSSTVLDSPNMYNSWNYQENMLGGYNTQRMYNQGNQNYSPWGRHFRENLKEFPDSTTAIPSSNLEEKDDKSNIPTPEGTQSTLGNVQAHFSGISTPQPHETKLEGIESNFRVPQGRPPSRNHSNMTSPDTNNGSSNTFLKPYPPEKPPASKVPTSLQVPTTFHQVPGGFQGAHQHPSPLSWSHEGDYFNQGYQQGYLNYDPYNPFGYDYGMRYQNYGYHQGFSNWAPHAVPQGGPMYQNNSWGCVYPPFSIPYPPEQPKSEPIGVVQDFIENDECFKDAQIGGVAIALGHGSVLFECAKHELHSTTALRKPNRLSPTRISLVFYQHRNLNKPKHGLEEWEEKMRLRKLGITQSPVSSNQEKNNKDSSPKDPQKEKDLNYAALMEAQQKNGKQIMLKSPTLTTVSWTTLFPMHPCVVTGPYQNSQPIG